jgi:hypothetical protein
VGRPGLQYLKQIARNTGAGSYTAMKRMACSNSSCQSIKRLKDNIKGMNGLDVLHGVLSVYFVKGMVVVSLHLA